MKLKDFLTLKVGAGILVSGTRYNPYINYSWSQTLTVGGNQQIKDTGTAGLNLQQFFGQGCWFNGIDQGISTDVKVSGASWSFALRYRAGRVLTESALSQFIPNNTGRFRIKTEDNGTRFNVQLGSYQINALLDTTAQSRDIYISYTGTILSLYSDGSFIESVDTLTPQVISVTNIEIGKSKIYYFNGIVKDVYAFNRVLTQTEIEKYTNQPNQFFMDSLEDSSCILAMPICEKNNLVRNYKNNTDYPITNYLATCRTNAQRLSYGLQTSGFKRDSNGLILSKSNFLEADGVGYGNTGWIPDTGQEFTIEWIYANPINGVDAVNEGIGIEINNSADFYLRQLRATGTINVKFGANSISSPSVAKMVYLAVTVTSGNFTIYINSINRGTSSNTYNRTLNTLNRTFFLGGVNRGGIEKIMTKESKLFKVHQKALSQEEVTQNFNKYQAQGLLNE